jgi:hypothetical protein
MTRKLKLLMPILTICFTSCGQTKTNNQDQNQKINTIDTSIVAILPFDTTQYWVFKNSKPTDLTNEDLQKIETIIKKCISVYNSDQERQFNKINETHPGYKLDKKNFIIDLTLYKRQYVAILNSKGEKEVWVNCFCRTGNQNWKKNLIFVLDGGNCFFNLKINLTTGQYYELMVNGDA